MNATVALWGSILLSAAGQLVLRRGVRTGGTQNSANSTSYWRAVLLSPWVWAYGFSLVGAMGLWLIAIARVPISYAYPLLSAGYIFVALMSRVFLGERVAPSRWLAIAVLSVGVALISLG
jgi:drug/metabolite transporter (DMT)-like permease